MTEAQEKLALDLINAPPPGSEIAKAKEFGVDLTLFLAALRCTPIERARVHQLPKQNPQPKNESGGDASSPL